MNLDDEVIFFVENRTSSAVFMCASHHAANEHARNCFCFALFRFEILETAAETAKDLS